MKLKNGTVLEVGKKYCFKDYQCVVRPITITAIGREYVLGIDGLAVQHLERVFEQMWKIDYDWLPYEEEKKEKWYEVIVYNSFGVGNRKCCNDYNLNKYECHVDIIREWDSKEDMIKELTK